MDTNDNWAQRLEAVELSLAAVQTRIGDDTRLSTSESPFAFHEAMQELKEILKETKQSVEYIKQSESNVRWLLGFGLAVMTLIITAIGIFGTINTWSSSAQISGITEKVAKFDQIFGTDDKGNIIVRGNLIPDR